MKFKPLNKQINKQITKQKKKSFQKYMFRPSSQAGIYSGKTLAWTSINEQPK